jgi:8-oxo-dGTP diphosphatase
LKQVAAAVALKDGRVLVTRRAPGEKLEGFWEFPGGKLEAGEDPQTCIVRELLEELGVECTAGEVIKEARYEYPGGAINLIAVEVTLVSEAFSLAVHDAFVWVEPRQLFALQLAPADIPIAKELVRRNGEYC